MIDVDEDTFLATDDILSEMNGTVPVRDQIAAIKLDLEQVHAMLRMILREVRANHAPVSPVVDSSSTTWSPPTYGSTHTN